LLLRKWSAIRLIFDFFFLVYWYTILFHLALPSPWLCVLSNFLDISTTVCCVFTSLQSEVEEYGHKRWEAIKRYWVNDGTFYSGWLCFDLTNTRAKVSSYYYIYYPQFRPLHGAIHVLSLSRGKGRMVFFCRGDAEAICPIIICTNVYSMEDKLFRCFTCFAWRVIC
jgi:hypothetical protein